jgi:arylsulfatase A-like enzyme
MKISSLALLLALACGCGGSGGGSTPPSKQYVIQIDIDDHGLTALWMANAPNLKGLIANGTLAYTRVIVPTHSNQSNMALLTGQYPDGNNVPANAWLDRSLNYVTPVNLPGLTAGDYARYDKNPLRIRGDSTYKAVEAQQLGSAFVGELPPFEVGADVVHLSIIGGTVGGLTVDQQLAESLLAGALAYPQDVIDSYHFDSRPEAGSLTRFTMADAADFIRTTPLASLPRYMFVWDFPELDGDPTSQGANSPGVIQLIEDYDAGIGDILSALTEKGIRDDTNILFTLDHGKVDTHNQVALGTRGGTASTPADGQLATAVAAMGPALGISTTDYALLNEDGDALLYAAVPNAETDAGKARQAEVAHALLTIIQSGTITGVDTTRTMTADGAMGTRKFHDFRGSSPNQPDIIVFPQDDWTLNQVDSTNTTPGPFTQHTTPYGRHGGFSTDELYVPLIMSGPAFKKGVLIPHPVNHPQVAPTAMAALGLKLSTADAGPVSAALVGDPGETAAQPADLGVGTRDDVLASSGFGGAPVLAGSFALQAVIIDAAGLYDDEIFRDDQTASAAGPIRQLAATGVRFEDFWTRSRDWPVTEYEMLVGGYPVQDPWVPSADEDPMNQLLPGAGLLLMPPAPLGTAANQAGFDRWRQTETLAGESLLDSAHVLGMTTAVVGQPDFHTLHIDPATIDVTASATADGAASALSGVLAQHPKLLALVALGGARTADRHSAVAKSELSALAQAVAAVAQAAPNALIVVTSRGGTSIDDPGSDFYGAGSSRHVPLVMVGPSVRAGGVSGQPARPADLPATVLFGLGWTTGTDFVDGTWAVGSPVGGIAQPSPKNATGGHALVRGFDFQLASGPAPLP